MTFVSPHWQLLEKRCKLMTFRKFHITPNKSEAFTETLLFALEACVGGGKWERGLQPVINVICFPCHHFKPRLEERVINHWDCVQDYVFIITDSFVHTLVWHYCLSSMKWCNIKIWKQKAEHNLEFGNNIRPLDFLKKMGNIVYTWGWHFHLVPLPCISSISVQIIAEQRVGYLLLFTSKQPAGDITFCVAPDCTYTNNWSPWPCLVELDCKYKPDILILL